MLDPKDSGVTMMSSHKISFSIIDILDPNKFNSKRGDELSIVKEKFPVPHEEGISLDSDSTAAEDFRVERTKAGSHKGLLPEPRRVIGTGTGRLDNCLNRPIEDASARFDRYPITASCISPSSTLQDYKAHLYTMKTHVLGEDDEHSAASRHHAVVADPLLLSPPAETEPCLTAEQDEGESTATLQDPSPHKRRRSDQA
ncbi:hypothetical protein FQN60_014881, partial [Etheostoma spectabile]